MWKGIINQSFTPSAFADYMRTLTLLAWRPHFVVVHNTGDPRLADWHAIPGDRRMRGLERYYRDDMKWSAGPHLFVADDRIWVFTPLTTPGVHAPSWNAVSWGVEIVGDYDHEPLHDDVWENTVSALATLNMAGGLDPAGLRLHREDPLTTHKSCPGVRIEKARLIAAVQARIQIDAPSDNL